MRVLPASIRYRWTLLRAVAGVAPARLNRCRSCPRESVSCLPCALSVCAHARLDASTEWSTRTPTVTAASASSSSGAISARRRQGCSAAEGYPLHLQLPGVGVDVQAHGGGVVRHRRATGSSAGVALHVAQGRGTKVLASDDLSEMFGIEIAPATPAKRSTASPVPRQPPSSGVTVDGSSKQKVLPPPAKSTKTAPARKAGGGGRRLTSKTRQAIAERMGTYWAERRVDAKRRKASKSP